MARTITEEYIEEQLKPPQDEYLQRSFHFMDHEDLDNILTIQCKEWTEIDPESFEFSTLVGDKFIRTQVPEIQRSEIECLVKKPFLENVDMEITVEKTKVKYRSPEYRVSHVIPVNFTEENMDYAMLFYTIGKSLRNNPVLINPDEKRLVIKTNEKSSGDLYKDLRDLAKERFLK